MTTLSIELEQETTSELQQFAEELGFTTTEFLGKLIKQTLRKRDFAAREELTPTPQLMEWIKEAREEYESGEMVAMNFEEAIAHLDRMIEESP
ncbi:MAG: hypothetical protein FWG68_01255 [Defluviitaleaceae bacterium]|nr:hypothetical protein [Defluviitaleaceae bacterium]